MGKPDPCDYINSTRAVDVNVSQSKTKGQQGSCSLKLQETCAHTAQC